LTGGAFNFTERQRLGNVLNFGKRIKGEGVGAGLHEYRRRGKGRKTGGVGVRVKERGGKEKGVVSRAGERVVPGDREKVSLWNLTAHLKVTKGGVFQTMSKKKPKMGGKGRKGGKDIYEREIITMSNTKSSTWGSRLAIWRGSEWRK